MVPLPLFLAVSAAAKPVPVGKAAGWFTKADYPVDALIEHQQGVAGFELQVGADGRPVSCRIYRRSGSPYLDDATCALAMERGRFTPPRKVKRVRSKRRIRLVPTGPALPSVYRHAVRWRLPNLNDTSDQTFVVRSAIAQSGEIDTCTITGPGALASGTSCGLFGNRAFLAGMLGANYARAATIEVRLDLAFAGAAPSRGARNPDAYFLLSEAAVTFAADGRLSGCTGLKALRAARGTTDLCKLIQAQPPRIAAGTAPRKAVYSLDLSAYFR